MNRRFDIQLFPVRIGPRRRQTFPDAPLASRDARFCAPEGTEGDFPSPWDAESPLEPSIARSFTGLSRNSGSR